MWTSHYEKQPVVPACVEVIFEMSFVHLFVWFWVPPGSIQDLFLALHQEIGDNMGYWVLNLCLMHSRQIPYLVYYLSGLRNAFERNLRNIQGLGFITLAGRSLEGHSFIYSSI